MLALGSPVRYPDKVTLEPGTRLGKYELLRQLGSGAMGVVYEAKHLTLGHHVAIKVLQQLATHGEGIVRRFEQEARIVARLESRHIVRVLDADQAPDGTRYLVMELMRGRDLSAIVYERHALRTEEVVDVALQVCVGLKHAHEAGIVHRDLKPANLFVAENDEGTTVKIMDFGISKDLASGANEQTASNIMIGTPNYMSPEQIRTSRSVDERSDLWSLGVIMYRLLAGCHPFVGDNHGAVLVCISTETPVDVRAYAAQVPEGLSKIIMQLLEKDPRKRPSSAAALGRLLLPFAPPYRDYPTFETGGAPDTVRNASPLADAKVSVTTQVASTVPSPEVESTQMPVTSTGHRPPASPRATASVPPPTKREGSAQTRAAEEPTLDSAATASAQPSTGAAASGRRISGPLIVGVLATSLLAGGTVWWTRSARIVDGSSQQMRTELQKDAAAPTQDAAASSLDPSASAAPVASSVALQPTAQASASSTSIPLSRPTARPAVQPPSTSSKPPATPSATVSAPTHIR